MVFVICVGGYFSWVVCRWHSCFSLQLWCLLLTSMSPITLQQIAAVAADHFQFIWKTCTFKYIFIFDLEPQSSHCFVLLTRNLRSANTGLCCAPGVETNRLWRSSVNSAGLLAPDPFLRCQSSICHRIHCRETHGRYASIRASKLTQDICRI